MIQGFASKHYGCTMITGRSQGCIIDATTSSCSPTLTKPTEELLRGSGTVETLDMPRHRLPPRCFTESLQLTSDWMPSENIIQYTTTHPHVDRLDLVCFLTVA
jgi:hypothetical protein